MRTFTLLAAATALAGGGLAVWRMQVASRVPAQHGGHITQAAGAASSSARGIPAQHGGHVTPPRWMIERLDAAEKPSNDAERRARALLDAGDLNGAEAECRRAVALAPLASDATGRKVIANGAVVQLLGEICLRQGKNHEALELFLGRLPHDIGGGLNMNVVIAYCRLGDYNNAKKFYSDGPLRSMCPNTSPLDFPGSRDIASLEASALLSLGLDIRAEHRLNEALADFLAAERLVPKNPLIAYASAETFMSQGNGKEALPRYRIAAFYGHGRIQSEAKKMAGSVEYWFRLHPEATPDKMD